MDDLFNYIKNRKINTRELNAYGFIKNGEYYEYHINLKNNEFELILKFSKDGVISTKVVDLMINDEFTLINVPGATGEYIGKIRQEIEEIIRDIYEKCSEIEVFKSKQAKQVIKYIKEKYGNEPEFLWAKFEGNAVFRHKKNKKWYGALLTVSKRKLGLDSDEKVEIIDLRILPEDIEKVVDNEKYFLGYHMNKQHWFTIILDGKVETERIFGFIDSSYGIK